MATANDVLNVAEGELGYSRYNDPLEGTKYGRWMADITGQSWYGATGIAYCVIFASWCLDQAGVTCPGLPSASTSDLIPHYNVAVTNAQPGDIATVETNNNPKDGPDHTCIVLENTGHSLKTVDGNVGNGRVLERERAYRYFDGIVRPMYDQATNGGSGGSGDSSQSHSGADSDTLLLDCDLGVLSVSAWARQLGLSGSDADGYISYQYVDNKLYLSTFSSCVWNWSKGCPGSPTAKAIQRKVGSANIDGVLGQVDIKNIQRYLNDSFGYHMVVDGICGPTTAYNIQHSINQGFWA